MAGRFNLKLFVNCLQAIVLQVSCKLLSNDVVFGSWHSVNQPITTSYYI